MSSGNCAVVVQGPVVNDPDAKGPGAEPPAGWRGKEIHTQGCCTYVRMMSPGSSFLEAIEEAFRLRREHTGTIKVCCFHGISIEAHSSDLADGFVIGI